MDDQVEELFVSKTADYEIKIKVLDLFMGSVSESRARAELFGFSKLREIR